jgi:hypothetical protein
MNFLVWAGLALSGVLALVALLWLKLPAAQRYRRRRRRRQRGIHYTTIDLCAAKPREDEAQV